MSASGTAPAIGRTSAPNGAKILAVEDDPDVGFALQATLSDAGYECAVITDGDEALRGLYGFQPDLVLLDLNLPGTPGMELCEQIRGMSDVPVIIFTAEARTDEKLEAFARGADDYVVKDCPVDELLARIAAGLRRARTPAATERRDDLYTDAVLEVDYARSEVKVRGERVNLTPTEYKILTFLVEQIGRPVPPDRLLKRVWGPEYSGEDLVKWHMAHLRRKIEADPDRPELVVTRRGFGYMYAPPGR